MLVGPYFVDWTRYRSAFEERASAALGMEVRVEGRAEARVLPTPSLEFTNVQLERGDTSITVERFRALVELGPLTSGEVNVLEMALERPRGTLDLGSLGQVAPTRRDLGFDPGRVSLSNVSIEDGALTLIEPESGRRFAASDLNAVIDASSLDGPLKVQGGMRLEGSPVGFAIATGVEAKGARPVKLAFEPANLGLTVQLDGLLLENEGRRGYEGRFSLERGLGEDTPAAERLRASGEFGLTAAGLSLPEFTASLGDEGNPVGFEGSGAISFGDAPRFNLTASSRQIDLDRLVGEGPGDPASPREAAGAALAHILSFGAPPIPGAVSLDVAGVVAGGGLIQDVTLRAEATRGGWRVSRASARLPGATRLGTEGLLTLSSDPEFVGEVALASERPPALAAWLGVEDTRRFAGRLALDAALKVTESDIELGDLALTYGETSVRGSIASQLYRSAEERYASVTLDAETLDLDGVRDLLSVLRLGPTDVQRVALSLTAERVLAGGGEARNVTLDGKWQDGAMELRELVVEDFAGASVVARGDLFGLGGGDPRGRIDATLEAERLDGLADIVTDLAGGAEWARRLERVAPRLSPASAELTFAAPEGVAGAFDLDLAARLDGTLVNANVASSGLGEGRDALARLDGEADLLVSSSDGAKLLRQLGLDVTPVEAGPGRIELAFSGSLGEGAPVTIEGELGGTILTFDGQARAHDGEPSLKGELAVTSPDIDPLVMLAGAALPEVGLGHPLRVKGPVTLTPSRGKLALEQATFDGQRVGGAVEVAFGKAIEVDGALQLEDVSAPFLLALATGRAIEPNGIDDEIFSPVLPQGFEADLDIQARNLALGVDDLVARNAAFRLRVERDLAAMDNLRAVLAGGALSGRLRAEVENGAARVTTRASLEGADLAELVWRDRGRAVARGSLDLSLNAAGRGRSPSGVVATLTGGGTLRVTDGSLLRINPRAFTSVIRAADSGLEIKEPRVREVFTGHLDAGILPFESLEAGFTIASGVVRAGSITLDTDSAAVLGSASVDLNEARLRSEWSLTVDPDVERVAGADPSVGLIFDGSIGRPRRQIDVSPLLGFLTVRSFEREVERIEMLQSDILERQRLGRLQRLSREEEERRAREADEWDIPDEPAEDAPAEDASESDGDGLPSGALARDAIGDRADDDPIVGADAGGGADRPMEGDAGEAFVARPSAKPDRTATAAVGDVPVDVAVEDPATSIPETVSNTAPDTTFEAGLTDAGEPPMPGSVDDALDGGSLDGGSDVDEDAARRIRDADVARFKSRLDMLTRQPRGRPDDVPAPDTRPARAEPKPERQRRRRAESPAIGAPLDLRTPQLR